MRSKKKPSYLLHRPTGQARVRIGGRDIYLGEYGTPESYAKYEELVAEFFRQGDVERSTITVDQLAIRFIDYARGYYVKNGKPTCEVNNIRIALRPLVKLFGTERARDFSPRKLKSVRQELIDADCVRTSINRQIGRIKRMFRWAVAEEFVPADTIVALQAVDGLRAGRSDAKESEPVKPVSQAAVDAVRPFVSRQVWAMIRLQILTGMRPGEVVIMRGCDINTSGRIWEYVPQRHKSEHHGKRRVVFLGPRAQAVVRDFLKPDLTGYLFSPADARAEFDAQRKANRKTPMTPSQRARKRKVKPKKTPGERYTVCSYGYAIRKGCLKADIPNWHPNQLRHRAGTELRRQFGIEMTRTVLGHSSAVTSEIYAEQDQERAREIAGRVG